MSLRPRYSLLTLLVLTALVAGGVKLWYGPHTTLLPTPSGEVEFTFTRDLYGKKYRQGPLIMRYFDAEESTEFVFIQYYNEDHPLHILYTLRKTEQPNSEPDFLDKAAFTHRNLSCEEQREFLRSIESEREKQKITSHDLNWYERLTPRDKNP